MILVLLLSGMVFCASCSQPSMPKADDAAGVTLDFRGGVGKAIAPGDLGIALYRIQAQGPSGKKISLETKDTRINVELVPGRWNILVDGLNASEAVLASGMARLDLASGERRTVAVDLRPLDGVGSLALNWVVEGEVGEEAYLEGSLRPNREPSGDGYPIRADADTGSFELPNIPAGAYLLELALWNGDGRLCGMADSVLILAGQMSSAELVFSPPSARLEALGSIPKFLGNAVSVVPRSRLLAPGRGGTFSLDGPYTGAWFLDGMVTMDGASSVELSSGAPGTYRIDWIGDTGGTAKASASARLRVQEGPGLGSLAWAETLRKEDLPVAAGQALDDCRDLAFSGSGGLLAVLGKNKATVGLFAYAGAGTILPVFGISRAEDPRLGVPGRAVGLPDGDSWAILSEGQGSVSLLEWDAQAGTAAIAESLGAPELIGATDLEYDRISGNLFLPVPGRNAVYRLGIAGGMGALEACITPMIPGLESFDRPASLALAPSGEVLVVGTLGDDGLYFFAPAAAGPLNFLYALRKEDLAGLGSLSDPVELAFDPTGKSLFVLSYYGKTIFRLDLDEGSGRYLPVAAAKSGVGGISGFDYPKRIALSSDGAFLAVSGSGSSDGLSLFSVGSPGTLSYAGTVRPADGAGALPKPFALTFAPGRLDLIAGSTEADELAIYTE